MPQQPLRNSNIHDLRGQRFHRLTVIDLAPRIKGKQGTYWICKCDCGTKKPIPAINLVGGIAKSCGCLRKELLTTHGMNGTAELRIWRGMIDRCTNPNHKPDVYARYGGRGITVCNEWMTFENFFCDMGPRPNKHLTIERIDNNKGYSKDNCKWGTRMEQSNNCRSNHLWDYEGEKLTLRQIIDRRKAIVNFSRVLMRLNTGWSIEDAFNAPKHTHRSKL